MDVNWIAILVAAVSSFLLGFIWYHPKTFGTAWMKSLGMDPASPPKGNMAKMFGVALIMAIVIAYNLNQWAAYHPVEDQTFLHGAFHAILTCSLGAIPVLVTNSLY
jgi:ABC-type amino acid transport system permease subunit